MAILDKSELLASFPDNTGGDITAENMRDFVESSQTLRLAVISTTTVIILDTIDAVLADPGASSISIPAIAIFKNRPLRIFNQSGGNITINPNGSETISGLSSLVMADNRTVQLFAENSATDWSITDDNEEFFTALVDTPSSFSSASLQGVRVNTGETALEFFDVFDTQQATATGSSTESSATFQIVSGMTITPGAGSYLVWFSGSWENDTTNRNIFLAIFANGVEVAVSEVRMDVKNADTPLPVSTHALITGLSDSQDIDIRWSANGTGTRTMHERTLTILKVSE